MKRKMNRKIKSKIFCTMAVILITVFGYQALSAQPKWQRSEPKIELRQRIFHSTQVIGLPTAETLGKGDFEFEISHRFQPPVTDGYEAFYGFDGPAKMRIALGYAVLDNLTIMVGRSNIDDNTDLEIKYQFINAQGTGFPIMAAFQFGAAWNLVETFRPDNLGNMIVLPKKHKRHFQYFNRLIINFQPFKNTAVGLVPSYLYNRDIRSAENENSFLLGTHYQLFLNKRWSVIGEWSFILSEKSGWYNPAGFGLELETGAHIFELYLTNQLRMNPSQYLAGADYPFDGDNLRLGFLVNRIF